MVAGKARPYKTMMTYVRDDRRDNRLLHALIRDSRINPAGVSSRPIGTASNISPISDDSLKVSGGTMVGPIAYFPKVFLISPNESDTLRIDENFGAYSSRVIVTGEGAAADNIEFIIGKDDGEGNIGKAAFAGQWLVIDAVITTPLTLIHGADISLPGGTNVTIPGGENAVLIYDSTSDKWNLLSISSGTAGGSVPSGTAVNDHLQWNGAAWIAQQKLNFDNNSIAIAMRNVANDGDLEIKAETNDFFDFTDSSEGTVTLQLRAQHAVDADKSLTISQASGSAGIATINSGTSVNIDVGATAVATFNSGGLIMNGISDIDMTGSNIGDIANLIYTVFGTVGKAITRFATGLHYDIENSAHSHVFRVLGDPPAEVMRIDNDQVLFSQDINFQGNLLLGTERADPGSPPAANTGVYYVKDSGGVSTPFFMGDDGIAIDLTTGAGFANTALSNLTTTSINTSLDPAADGVDSLGLGSFSWNDLNIDRIIFRHNDGILATSPSIGRSSNALRLNSPTGNSTTIEEAGSALYDFAPTIFSLQNNVLAMQIIGATTTHSFTNLANTLEIKNSAGVATRRIALDGERLALLGTGGTNTEFRFQTDQASAGTDIAKIIFEGHDAGAVDTDYAAIVGQVLSPTGGAEAGSLVLRVAEGGTENVTYLTLNGSSIDIKIFKDIDLNDNDLLEIGTGTITLLTEELVPTTGDFIFGFEATSGAMRKFNIGNLPAGGGGVSFPIEPTVTDNGSGWSNPQTLDLNVGDGHVFKWTVDQNLTFAATVTNIPASLTQRTFELEFVHDGVGGTFTVTLPNNFTNETGKTLTTFTISNGNTVLLTCRVNDGTNFLVVQKNVKAVSGGAFLPLAGGTMTGQIDMDGNQIILAAVGTTRIEGTSSAVIMTVGGTSALYDFKENSFDILTKHMIFREISTPGSAFGNSGFLYVKEVGGTHSELFYKDELGTETNIITAGGTSPPFDDDQDIIQDNLDNTKKWRMTLDAINTGQTKTFSFVGGNSATYTFQSLGGLMASLDLAQTWSAIQTHSNDILFSTGGVNIGDGTNKAAAVFATNLRFNASTRFINVQSNVMHFEVGSGDLFDWEIFNLTQMSLSTTALDLQGNKLVDVFDIEFDDISNTITADGDGMILKSATIGDYVRLEAGTDGLEFEVNGTFARLRTTNSTLDPQIVLHMNDPSPTINQLVGRIFFDGEDSASNQQTYGRIDVTSTGVTSGSERGQLELKVATGTSGALVTGLDITGDATSGILLGFRSAAAQAAQAWTDAVSVRRTVSTGDTLAQVVDALGTLVGDLEAMGLLG